MSALSRASALTIAMGSFLSFGPHSAQRVTAASEAQRKHLLITYRSLISVSSCEALTTSCMLELTKGGRSRMQESPVWHLPKFKNKPALWVTNCLGLVEF